MPPIIRMAGESDAIAMLAIYAHYVRTTAISFELEPPEPSEFSRRIRETTAFAPWLVCEDARGHVAGYAYGSRFRPRPAYRWTIEVTVYVAASHHRRGIGRALYTALLGCLRVQQFQTATAGIALPNDASIRLHESVGFLPVGVFHAAGFKLGKWHDVSWFELQLGDRGNNPGEPIPTASITGTDAWKSAIAAGQQVLKG